MKKERFSSAVFSRLLDWPDFPGKWRLLNLMRRLKSGELYLWSTYGVWLRERTVDATWLLAYRGHKDRTVFEQVSKLAPGNAFVDVGANVGLYSLLAGQRVGRSGLIVSVEPNVEVFRDLVSNFCENALECVWVPLNVAITKQPRLLGLSFDPKHSGVSHIEEADQAARAIVGLSWDGIGAVNKVLGDRTTVVKCDVEGCELEVLRSMESLLSQSNVIKVIVEIDHEYLERFGADRKGVYDYLQGLGFRATRELDATHFDEVFVRV